MKKDPEEKHHWLVDEEAADVVRRIFRMSIEGMGPNQTAKALMQGKADRPSCYLAKQGRGTWQLAQRSRQTVRRTDTTGMANPLTGLMFCANCGAKMYNHKEGAKALKEGWKHDPDSGLYPTNHYDCSTSRISYSRVAAITLPPERSGRWY